MTMLIDPDVLVRPTRGLNARQRQLLRKRYGGDATPEQLYHLAQVVNSRRFR